MVDARQELVELLKLRASQRLLNNRIHDLAAALAVEALQRRHPRAKFLYEGAASPGFDIRGTLEQKLVAACEVSTHDKYQGNRQTNVDEDLRRLQNAPVDPDKKYLAVVSALLKEQLLRNRRVGRDFPDVQVLNVLEDG
jgi:hypothetical protein